MKRRSNLRKGCGTMAASPPAVALSLLLAAGQQPEHLELSSDDVLFDSWDPPGSSVASIGWLGDARFLGRDQIVFVDDSVRAVRIHDLVTGLTKTVGRAEPTLPSTIRLIGRSSTGALVMADDHYGSLSTLSHSGTVSPSGEYDAMRWKPICVLADGIPVGASRAMPTLSEAMRASVGVRRDTMRYAIASDQKRHTLMAKVLGDEHVWVKLPKEAKGHSSRRVPVVFGHRVLEACQGDHLVMGLTDENVVRLYDRTGTAVTHNTLPSGRRISPQDVVAGRSWRVSADARQNRVERRRYAFLSSVAGMSVSFPDIDSLKMQKVPANETSPSIDRLWVDAHGRLWIRKFLMPRDNWAHWRVQSTVGSPPTRLHTARDTEVLDAYDDQLLLRRTSAQGTDRLLVVRTRLLTDHRPAARFRSGQIEEPPHIEPTKETRS